MDCEKIQSKDFDELVTNFENMMQKEKENCKKRTIGYIISGTVVLIFLIYITSFVSSYISPRLIFDFVQVKGTSQLQEMNKAIRDAAPKVVTEWSAVLSKQMPVIFRQKMDAALSPAIDAFASKFSTDLKFQLAALYKKDSMKQILKGKQDPQKGFEKVFNEVSLSYTKEITNFYKKNVGAIHNLKADLERLSSSKKLTEREQYAKKVIGAWLSLLDHKGAYWDIEDYKQKTGQK